MHVNCFKQINVWNLLTFRISFKCPLLCEWNCVAYELQATISVSKFVFVMEQLNVDIEIPNRLLVLYLIQVERIIFIYETWNIILTIAYVKYMFCALLMHDLDVHLVTINLIWIIILTWMVVSNCSASAK